eukprot:m.193665 g.193665  ORF g.193665 m.193665 type:complete len:480 (-) comp14881_c0_seq15:999-2438(-)
MSGVNSGSTSLSSSRHGSIGEAVRPLGARANQAQHLQHQEDIAPQPQLDPVATLWMGDLERHMNEAFILKAFETMGHVPTQVRVITKMTTTRMRKSAGYCFVSFDSRQSAEAALAELNGTVIPRTHPVKIFYLNWAHSHAGEKPPEDRVHSLYVGNLPPHINDHALLMFFKERYPSCRGAKVVFDDQGKSRGFGFLRFASQRDQQRCLDEMNQQPGCDSDKLSVSFAYPTKGQGRQPGVRQPQGQHQPRPRRHAPHAGPQAGQPTFNIINLGHGQIPEQLALQLAALNQAGRLGNVVTVGAMPGVDYQPQMMGGPMYPGQPRQMMRQRMAPMPHPWQAQHTQMGSFSVPPSTPSGPSAWSSTWTGAPYQQQALPMQRQSGMVPSQSSNAFSMGELDAALDESPNPQLYDPVTGGFGDVPSSDTQDAVGGDSRFDPSPFGRFDLGGGSGRRQHLATMSSHSYDMAPLGGPSLADDFNPMF